MTEIDISSAFLAFLQIPNRWLKDELDGDRLVVATLGDALDPARTGTLRHWLERYSVLQGFNSEQRNNVCVVVCDYADARKIGQKRLAPAEILSEFAVLEQRLLEVAPPCKDGSKRSVTSLCSKALWCCFPDSIPIFDRNATTALAVLSRLMRLDPADADTEYERFINAWLLIFDVLRPDLESDTAVGLHGYSTRALDRFLWYLANPSLRAVREEQRLWRERM